MAKIKQGSILLALILFQITGNVVAQETEVFVGIGHKSPIRGVDLSIDEQYLLTADNSVFKLWNYSTGRLVKSIPIPLSGEYGFRGDIVLSADNNIIAFRFTRKLTNHYIGFLNISTGNLTGEPVRMNAGSEITAIKDIVSSDRKYIFFSTFKESDFSVAEVLYKISTGEEVFTKNLDGLLHKVSYSKNNKYIFISTKDQINFGNRWEFLPVYKINIETEKLHRMSNKITKRVDALALSKDGTRAITVRENRRYELWDLTNGNRINRSKITDSKLGGTNGISDVSLSKDGSLAVVGFSYQNKKQVKIEYEYPIFNPETGRLLTLDGVSKVMISPDNRYVSFGESIFDVESNLFMEVATANMFLSNYTVKNAQVFVEDEEMMLIHIGKDQGNPVVKLLDINTGEIQKSFRGNEMLPEYSIPFVSSKAAEYLEGYPAKHNPSALPPSHYDQIGKVFAYAPDGISVITEGESKNIFRSFDLAKGEFTSTFEITGSDFNHYHFTYTPNGQYLLAGPTLSAEKGFDGQAFIQIWEISTGQRVRRIDLEAFAVNELEVSPQGEYLLISTTSAGKNQSTNRLVLKSELTLLNLLTGEKVRTVATNSGPYGTNAPFHLSTMSFSTDGSKIAAGRKVFDKDAVTHFQGADQVSVWKTRTGEMINSFRNSLVGWFSPDGKRLGTVGRDTGDKSKLWNVDSGQLIATLRTNTSIGFSEDGMKIYAPGEKGEVIIYNGVTGRELASVFLFEDGEWIAMTPQGYYDASENGSQYLNVRIEQEIFPIDNFFDTYYRPDIVRGAINGDAGIPSAGGDMFAGGELPPTVGFTSPADRFNSEQQTLILTTEITDRGGGIDEVRLFHNGKVISTETRGLKVVSDNNTLNPEFEVNLLPGENVFRLIAFSEGDRIESNPATLAVNYEGAKSNTRLFTLTIGINKYKNPKYSLNYARSDASGFEERIIQGGESIFDEVVQTTITDSKATKVNIFAALDKIKTAAGPEDMFVFYYAGHGVMSDPLQGPSEFFMAPTDVTQLYGNEALLKSHGIAASEIQEYSKNIMAQKQLFVLDACQSGGATEMLAMRGATEEKAIAQLARSTGTFWLTASGSEQFATEFATLGHGVFTYALLEGLNGKADQGAKDNKITVQELSAFLNDRVPELTQIHKGQAQYPSSYGYGQDFPIGVIK